ncbi:hypothetical protein FACS1894125_0740 [Actinomycetota bacterium]|nr:hypothetical protein FACS1894125_0740 [Actinomycetota bacterium]
MAQNEKVLDREYMIHLLKKLDRELNVREIEATLYVVGGAAIAFEIYYPRTTTDIDVVMKIGGEEVFEAARAVAKTEEGLGNDWLNAQFTGGYAPGQGMTWSWFDNKDDDNPSSFFEGDRLRVEVASPEMLLALKTLASRDKDLNDIYELMRQTGLKTYFDLSSNIERFTGKRLFLQQGSTGNYIHINKNIRHILNNAPEDLRPKIGKLGIFKKIKSIFSGKSN